MTETGIEIPEGTGWAEIVANLRTREFFPAEPRRILSPGLRYGLGLDPGQPVFIKPAIATIQKFGEKNSRARAVRTKFKF